MSRLGALNWLGMDPGRRTLANLQFEYKRKGLALCLGSGVSRGSGLPDWSGLLRRLAKRAYPRRKPEFYDNLCQSGLSLPALAALLEARIDEQKSAGGFFEVLKNKLYQGSPLHKAADVSIAQKKLMARQKREPNTTLAAVGALCTVASEGGFAANPRIHAIVNLNFDVLLTTYLSARYGRGIAAAVDTALRGRGEESIPCYHAHGRISHIAHANPLPGRAEYSSDFVFTEQQYFDFFNRPFSVFSYTMMFLLRENKFLFVGTALKDDNLRRLLHYSRSERRATLERFQRGRSRDLPAWLTRHFLIECRAGNRELEDEMERSLERLGVRTIWIDNWAELPQLMAKLYQSAGDDWSAVYTG